MSYKGKIICGPLPPDTDSTPAPPTCCSPGGAWSAWSKWSVCTGTCGKCGTANRNRTCLTTAAGCPCTGDAAESRECFVKGVWGDWIVQSQCNGTCGGCGTVVYNRTCLSTDCDCEGSKTLTQPCSFSPCIFPNASCCNGLTAGSYQGQVLCGPLPEYTENNPLENCTSCCPNGGSWSEWTQTTQCTDTCGSCAQVTKTRSCLSEGQGCPCTGNSTKYEYCGTSPCKFPRNSCCGTFKAMSSNGKIICGPLPTDSETTPAPTTCCVTGGLWSSWGAWSSCQGTCNQCGTAARNRTCTSESSGCPCTGNSTESKECKVTGIWNDWVVQLQCNDTCGACGTSTFTRTCKSTDCSCKGLTTKTEACAFSPCIYPRDSCCGTYKAGSYQGQIQCGPLPESTELNPLLNCTSCCPSGGVWSDWTQTTQCTDTCGSCAQVTKTRTCLSEGQGCPCTGNSTTYEYCGTSPCKFPRNSCCGTFKAMSSNGKIICGPLPTSDPEPTPSFASCCLDGGSWSTWSEWASCQGTCRKCGTTNRTRTCLSAADGCPCTGDDIETDTCKVTGTWGPWTVSSQCNDTCGACGVMTYTRTCATSACACVGAATKTEACAFSPCIYPRDSCCGTYKAGSYQGQIQCGPLPTAQPDSTVSICTTDPPTTVAPTTIPPTTVPACVAGGEWSAWSTAKCNDTCGLCGLMVQTRTCNSQAKGCPCTGVASQAGTVRCADALCPFPRASCCTAYAKRAAVGGVIKCIKI
uniref:Uncharacterized protein n=1 Tax=Panagrolaimus davidi TaxID=227884 RepID=A0A914QB14_9BILA